jgi:recombination protein RecA
MGHGSPTLDVLIAQLQQRFGPLAARRATALHDPDLPYGIFSGLPALDRLLPEGIPRGALVELTGAAGTGGRTLALHIVAEAQRRGDLACYLDLGQSLAGDYAARCGVDLDALAVARPADAQAAGALLLALIEREAVGVIVLDNLPRLAALAQGASLVPRLLERLPRLLVRSTCALLVFNQTPLPMLSPQLCPAVRARIPAAALRLTLSHAGWMRVGTLIVGRQTRVEVRRPPFDAPGPAATVELAYGLHEDGR